MTCTGREILCHIIDRVSEYTLQKKKPIEKGQIGIRDNATINTAS